MRAGRYINKKVAGESYRAYVPADLPPDPPIDLATLYPLLERAMIAVAELNSLVVSIPNVSLFTYMYVRKEALLSSQIEGTQSSLSDLMLFEHHQKPVVSVDDVEEVSNYVKAMTHGLTRLRGGFPLSLRLLKEMHAILLSGGRGSAQHPGQFRHSQNWIGGTRPGNAFFVPPPVEILPDCLSNLEKFLHDRTLPVLVKAGVAHVQFETIHPFLDGNGRLGRLLITLLLCEAGVLAEPILYSSLYLKQNRNTYYELLQEVRLSGRWEAWLEFFLTAVIQASLQAVQLVRTINKLFDDDKARVAPLGRARRTCEATLDYLHRLPQVSVATLAEGLGVSAPTARQALERLTRLGIIQEISGKQRDKIYQYKTYLDLLQEGAEPIL